MPQNIPHALAINCRKSYNGSTPMMAKTMITLELHYLVIQLLVKIIVNTSISNMFSNWRTTSQVLWVKTH